MPRERPPARIHNFALSDDREFEQLATDGRLSDALLVKRRVWLSPAAHAELLVGFTPGETVARQ